MGAAERGEPFGAGPGALLAPPGEAQPISAPLELEAGQDHPLQGGGLGAHQWFLLASVLGIWGALGGIFLGNVGFYAYFSVYFYLEFFFISI